jgi:hypothetical protein
VKILKLSFIPWFKLWTTFLPENTKTLQTCKSPSPTGPSLLPYPITTIPQCCFFACRKLIYFILIFLCKLFKFFIQTYSKLNQLPKGKSVKRVYAVNYFVLLAELPKENKHEKTFLGLSSATEHLTMAVRGEKWLEATNWLCQKFSAFSAVHYANIIFQKFIITMATFSRFVQRNFFQSFIYVRFSFLLGSLLFVFSALFSV